MQPDARVVLARACSSVCEVVDLERAREARGDTRDQVADERAHETVGGANLTLVALALEDDDVFAFVLQFSANSYSEPILGPAQTDNIRPPLFRVPPLRGPPV